ncbi:unnamed protein product [[Candida] boidinii]|nr:unnamed protein product [[Candida] boidinii]
MSRKFVLHSKKRNTLTANNSITSNNNNNNNNNSFNDLSKEDLLNFEKSVSKSRLSSSSFSKNNSKSTSAPTSPNAQRKNLYAELFNSDNEDENSTSSNSNNSSNSDIPQANNKLKSLSLSSSSASTPMILKRQKYTIDELMNLKHDKILKFEKLDYILNNLEYKKNQSLPMLSNNFLKK